MTTLPPRSEINEAHTWNAPSVYETPAAWEAAFKATIDRLPELAAFKGKLADGPAILADWFELSESIARDVEKLVFYAFMTYSVDTTNQAAAAMAGKSQGLGGQFGAAVSFAEPEILAIGLDTLNQWMDKEARLKPFAHYFDNLFRQQAHVRSAEVEEVLGLVSEPFGSPETIFSMLVDSDMTFAPAVNSSGEELHLAQGMVETYRVNPDRELRRTAWINYADAHLALKNTLASAYIAVVRQDVFKMRVRGFKSSVEAALFPENIPVEVFDNLIGTFKKHLPTWHRYLRVLKKGLGVDKLQMWDRWAPLIEKPVAVSYEQAVDWICDGLAPMGEEYVNTIRQGCLEDRWVDIYPNQGKRQGAFSYGSYDTYPFIMMSFSHDLSAMSTLAHELGHSMHTYHSCSTQPHIYGEYSIFAAEVASNFHQAMVRSYLFDTIDDPTFQIGLIQEAMENLHRYFFIMPTLARFEHEVHQRIEQGEGVTADDLNNLMADLYEEGYGGEIEIDRERVGITWAQFPHMYMNYYTFQYATGISGAHALSNRVRSGVAGAAEDYIGFISAGSSDYALDVLKAAGVDLTTPAPVEETFGVLSDLVDRLEGLVG